MKLEEKRAKLEQYATDMELKDIPLEEALNIFQESVQLAQECIQTLNDCNGKLTVLTEQVKGLTDEK